MATQQVGGVTIEVGLNPNTSKYEFNTTWPSGKTGTISADTLKNLNNPLYLAARRSEFIATLTDPADIAAATTFYRDLPVVIPVMEQQFAYEQAAMTEQDTIVTDPVNNADQAKNLNNQYGTAGGGDDDSGNNNNTTKVNTEAGTSGSASSNYPYTVAPTSGNSGTTNAGKAGTSQTSKYGMYEDVPGRRPYNPLSEFSSYTYQLSLYMLTPEALNLYMGSGFAQRSDGWYLLAQSAGINNNPTPGQAQRAPGIDLDFYIDDLEFTTHTNSSSAGSPVMGQTKMRFKIYEPYGISFTRKLTDAAREVQKKSSFPGVNNNPNALKQCYVIGIRFYGYDKDGNLMKATDFPNPEPTRTNDNAVFERFYAITLTSMTFKLDGKAVIYNIEATNTAIQESLGVIRGTLPADVEINAKTIKEALQGQETTNTLSYEEMKVARNPKTGVQSLLGFLNQYEIEVAQPNPKTNAPAKKKLPNRYLIEFQNSLFDNVAFYDPREFAESKNTTTMSTAGKTNQSNPKSEKNATVNKSQRNYKFAAGASIVSIIEQIIANSEYIRRSLKQLDSELIDPKPVQNPNPHKLSWFSIIPQVKIIGYDTQLCDYQYEIKYQIAEYKIPYIKTSYSKYTSRYPGPHKMYNYWLTGKNSEVLRYEQQYNTLYFLTATGEEDTKNGIPITQMIKPSEGSTTGQQNKAGEAVNAVKEDLYSPGDLASAKLTILGDPDYLIQPIGIDINSASEKIYGKDGYSINPVGGQVFIEIFFQTATDYTNTTTTKAEAGLMDVNDSIRFYAYPGEISRKVKGITYMITEVQNKFSKGAFVQDLKLVIASLEEFTDKNENKQDTQPREEFADARDSEDGTRISTNYLSKTRLSNPSDFGNLRNALRDQDSVSQSTLDKTYAGDAATITTENGSVVQDDDAWKKYSAIYGSTDAGREEISTVNPFQIDATNYSTRIA